MKPLMAQFRSELLRTSRDRRFFLLTLGMPVIFYIIFINQAGGLARIGGTFWNVYFMVSMAAFGVVGSSVNTLGVRLAAERQSGWVRWLRTTPLSTVGYAMAKVMTQLTLSLAIIVVVFLVAHFSQNVNMPTTTWIEVALWLWLGSLPFASLGVLIGMAGNAAQILGTLAYLVLSMLGGLLTPIQALPMTMQDIAKWMPTYHFANPAWNILGGKGIEWQDIAVLIGWAVLFLALAAYLQKRMDARAQN